MTHPNTRFAWDDAAELRAFVATFAFAQICVIADGRPLLAHAPISLEEDGAPRFHLARANAVVPYLAGAEIAASIVADDFYVSPDWYAKPTDQVPTWNYRAVEIYGRARQLDEDELRAQLDRLAAAQEARLAPKPPWTNAKVSPPAMVALLRGIVGFDIADARFRGTMKLSQNRPAGDVAGVIAALRANGAEGHARAMETVS